MLDEVAEGNGGRNGEVAADDMAMLPNEAVVAPRDEAEGEAEVEPAVPNKDEGGNESAVPNDGEAEDGNPKDGDGAEAVDDPNVRGSDAEAPILVLLVE